MTRSLLLSLCLLGASASHAAEGMWTFDNLPLARMQAEYGFAPDRAWIDKVMHASVRLAGGCSGAFISRDGLVMTNQHCAVECVAQLSAEQRNRVEDGFLAAGREQELRCPNAELNRLEQIVDVTEPMLAATRGLSGAAFVAAQNAVRARLTADCAGTGSAAAATRCDLVDLYRGGQFMLYRYHRYTDTRLVWVPEEAIAEFGGDPDNFNFPRFALDIALLRAYENGKPVSSTEFLPLQRGGAAAGELTLVTGHPGSTNRLLTVAQLESRRDDQLVEAMLSMSELRGVLTQYGRQGAEADRVSHQLLLVLENQLKVYRGELRALQNPELMRVKRADEESLKAFVAGQPALQASTGGAWAAIEQAQQVWRNLRPEYDAIASRWSLSGRYFGIARTLVRAAAERPRPDGERLPEFSDARLPQLQQQLFSPAPIYPDYEQLMFGWSLVKLRERLGPDHELVKRVLGRESPAQLAARLVQGTALGDMAARRALWDGGAAAIATSTDPFIVLARAIDPDARALRRRMESEVDAVEAQHAERIAQARFAQLGTRVYPDATFSLRLSYGEIKGWTERDRAVPPFTTLGGAFQRHSGAAPFALPASWLAAKDRLDLSLPFNFVTSNDIIGGNSGSPVINRRAEVVGLAFDGNIHSIGGAFGFDERNNRMVALHSAAILEVLRKVYRADALLREIEP